MAKFLTDELLNESLENIIRDAKRELILVSPYIKLHHNYYSLLNDRLKEKTLKMYLIFRECKKDKYKYIRNIDLDFFKKFPNIEIRMHKNLHAKMYANESDTLVTSMNLYNYSQKNNIEFGLLHVGNKAEYNRESLKVNEVIRKSFAYLRRKSLLIYESKIAESGKLFPEYYPDIIHDNIKDILNEDSNLEPGEFFEPDEGFCIRTGKKIKFNIYMPMCTSAYNIWKVDRKGDYPELFCHFSGEETYGRTSFGKPILKKNWNKAMEKFHLQGIIKS